MVKLPVEFNPSALLGENKRFVAEIPLNQFKRLGEALSVEPVQQCVTLELALHKDSEGRVNAVGQISTVYPLQCQRCMTTFDYAVETGFRLTFVADEAAAEALDEALDPVILDENGRIHVVDLLEDELIFQLPLAPRHENEAQCRANGYTGSLAEMDVDEVDAEAKPNPFEILKQLTTDKD